MLGDNLCVDPARKSNTPEKIGHFSEPPISTVSAPSSSQQLASSSQYRSPLAESVTVLFEPVTGDIQMRGRTNAADSSVAGAARTGDESSRSSGSSQPREAWVVLQNGTDGVGEAGGALGEFLRSPSMGGSCLNTVGNCAAGTRRIAAAQQEEPSFRAFAPIGEFPDVEGHDEEREQQNSELDLSPQRPILGGLRRGSSCAQFGAGGGIRCMGHPMKNFCSSSSDRMRTSFADTTSTTASEDHTNFYNYNYRTLSAPAMGGFLTTSGASFSEEQSESLDVEDSSESLDVGDVDNPAYPPAAPAGAFPPGTNLEGLSEADMCSPKLALRFPRCTDSCASLTSHHGGHHGGTAGASPSPANNHGAGGGAGGGQGVEVNSLEESQFFFYQSGSAGSTSATPMAGGSGAGGEAHEGGGLSLSLSSECLPLGRTGGLAATTQPLSPELLNTPQRIPSLDALIVEDVTPCAADLPQSPGKPTKFNTPSTMSYHEEQKSADELLLSSSIELAPGSRICSSTEFDDSPIARCAHPSPGRNPRRGKSEQSLSAKKSYLCSLEQICEEKEVTTSLEQHGGDRMFVPVPQAKSKRFLTSSSRNNPVAPFECAARRSAPAQQFAAVDVHEEGGENMQIVCRNKQQLQNPVVVQSLNRGELKNALSPTLSAEDPSGRSAEETSALSTSLSPSTLRTTASSDTTPELHTPATDLSSRAKNVKTGGPINGTTSKGGPHRLERASTASSLSPHDRTSSANGKKALLTRSCTRTDVVVVVDQTPTRGSTIAAGGLSPLAPACYPGGKKPTGLGKRAEAAKFDKLHLRRLEEMCACFGKIGSSFSDEHQTPHGTPGERPYYFDHRGEEGQGPTTPEAAAVRGCVRGYLDALAQKVRLRCMDCSLDSRSTADSSREFDDEVGGGVSRSLLLLASGSCK